MTVTVIARWKVADVAQATKDAKTAKALWLKHGAQDCRLSHIFTGPYTGQMIFAAIHLDMAAYAKTSAAVQADPAWAKLVEDIRKYTEEHGGGLEEREFLMGVDI